MAISKQTTAFDETPPAYFLSDEVADAAGQVIADNVGFRDLAEIRIAFAFRTDAPYSEDDGIDDIVAVTVENAMRRCLGPWDATLSVKADYWKANPHHHTALLTHGLSHLMVDENGKVKKLPHDVEAFHREAVKHGAWRQPLSRFWTAMQIERVDETEAAAKPDPDKVVDLANQARRSREGRDE